jgi:hypothetical protein
MTTKRFFTATRIAVFAMVCLFTGRLFAQAQDGNRYSTPINMLVNAGTSEERMRSSHFGSLAPVGMRPSEQIAITLNVPGSMVAYPVGIAPLDGGTVFAAEELFVNSDRTVSFDFVGGKTPGLYRVLVNIASQQYELQFYVPKPEDMELGCVPP